MLKYFESQELIQLRRLGKSLKLRTCTRQSPKDQINRKKKKKNCWGEKGPAELPGRGEVIAELLGRFSDLSSYTPPMQ